MGTKILDLKKYKKIPKFIAVEGPIGVGKTTLSQLLAESFGYETFLERASENPFLKDFYLNPSQAALATQLFFLFQRVKQTEELRQEDIFSTTKVSDFLLDKDKLFAEITLSDKEFSLYEQIYNHLSIDLPIPDLVIYLQAETKTLLSRVKQRGLEIEKNITFTYLDTLNEAYKEFFLNFDRSPVLIVNSEFLDLVNRKEDYVLLLEKLLEYFNNPEGRMMYFNPTPSLV